MYNDDATLYYTDAARKIVDKCDELILYRSRVSDKEDFARLVIQNLFGNNVIDLLSLKPKFDEVHAEALNRLNGLIGFESSVFKTIYTNDSLFDDFIKVFANHAINSKADASLVGESIYMWLLLEYLGHILPTDEARLNLIKNSNWLSTTFASTGSVSSVSSPRRLLRPEVLAASSPLEHVSLRSTSLRNLYPRLLQFVGSLIQHLSSLDTWPSIAQCEVLKAILNHYQNFILLDTDDADFSSLKLMLIKKSYFTNVLQTFVERLLMNWPLSNSYIRLIELWITLTYRSVESGNDQKQCLFLNASTRQFIGYFEVIIDRLLDADCVSVLCSYVLEFLETRIFSVESPFRRLFKQYGLATTDYVELLMKKLERFKDEQSAIANVNEEDSFLAKMAHYLSTVTTYSPVDIVYVEQHIQRLRAILSTMQNFDDSINLNSDSSYYNASTSIVNDSTSKISVGETTEVGVKRYHPTLAQKLREEQQSKIEQVPDHEVDPWTQMLFLTPSGRAQVC